MGKERYSSRVAKRKDKKVNKIYNILISVVVLLIVVVGAVIFLGGNDEQPASNDTQTASNTADNDEVGTDKDTETTKDENDTATDPEDGQTDPDESGDEASSDSDKDASEEKEPADSEDEEKESEITEETPSDSNVEKAYTDTAWKPVGTEQSGEHVTQYEQGSVDWQEMEKALAYGAGISEGDMKVYWLGNGGSPDTAVGTVSPSDDSATYRVHIQWVDGQGWKPTKVEKLKVNDKK